MTPLESAILKLQRETGYGDRDVQLTAPEIEALIAAATAVQKIAEALRS